MRVFEWDNAKNQININQHKLSFEQAKALFDNPLQIALDSRFEYYENCYIGVGELDGRVMVVVFTMRKPNKIRLISFRKANNRECKEYTKNQLERS